MMSSAGFDAVGDDITGGLDPSRVLVLRSGFTRGDDYFMEAMRRRGICADVSLRPLSSRALRGARRLHLYSRFPAKRLWFGSWVRRKGPFDLIIVHAADLTLPAAEYAARLFPHAQTVFWFWNPAARGTDPRRVHSASLDCWSFDEQDCRTYGMRPNTQFMFSEIAEVGARVAPDIDFGFYGADKGRAPILMDVARTVEGAGLSHRFQVVGDSAEELGKFPLLISAPGVDYGELLEQSARFRVIVDIVQEGQSGMTLRGLEALYLRRKVLTNARAIRDSPLYDPERVFIWGEDSVDRLPAFVGSEYPEPPADVLTYYDFSSWLARFTKHGAPLPPKATLS
ncbi:hypothetical protein [Propionibacterium freudenreichii]|nr:hypothetical protein [Propionibacterium freudenreichii]